MNLHTIYLKMKTEIDLNCSAIDWLVYETKYY